jgi:hypothetical protein
MKVFFDKYGIFVILAFLGFMMWRMNKMMTMQTTLLFGMANKMGMDVPAPRKRLSGKREVEQEAEDQSQHTEEAKFTEEQDSLTDDQIEELIAELRGISDKIKAGEELSEDDDKFYRYWFPQMNDDLKLEAPPAPQIKEKAVIIPLVPEVINDGKAESSEPNAGSHNGNADSSKNNDIVVRKYTGDEKKTLLIGFLSKSNFPIFGKELDELLAAVTGLKKNPGNTSGLLAELIKAGKLKSFQKNIEGKSKTFFGLSAWFDGKKIKKEYSVKIK